MNHEDYILDALEMVSAWEIDPEHFSQAVNEQARLMAGLNLEPSIDPAQQTPYASLRF